jgi:hypothetical protein
MSPGPGQARLGAARIKWNRLADGRVCFGATWPGYEPNDGTPPADCMRHLRADEITFVIRKTRSGRQIIAGLKGPRVKAVRLRLLYPTRTWSPASRAGAFFGYVPSGTVTAVVKVLGDGTTKAFPFHAVSKR